MVMVARALVVLVVGLGADVGQAREHGSWATTPRRPGGRPEKPPVLGRDEGTDECLQGTTVLKGYDQSVGRHVVPTRCCDDSEWVYVREIWSWVEHTPGESICPAEQNRTCLYEPHTGYYTCALAVGLELAPGDPQYDWCSREADNSARVAVGDSNEDNDYDSYSSYSYSWYYSPQADTIQTCPEREGMRCRTLVDEAFYCLARHEVEISLMTGLASAGLPPGPKDIPQDELQAVAAMALLALQDYNSNRTGMNCGLDLRLLQVFADDEGTLNPWAYFAHASLYDLAGVVLRRLSMLHSLLGAAHAYGRFFASASISSESVWSDDVFRKVIPVNANDKAIGEALCATFARLGVKAFAILLPGNPSQDDLHRAETLRTVCSSMTSSPIRYPLNATGPEAAIFADALRSTLFNVFVFVGPVTAGFEAVTEIALSVGKLGKGTQWVFLDRAVRHEAEAANTPEGVKAALSGSLVLDPYSTDADGLADVLAAGWSNLEVPDISRRLPTAFGGAGFTQASFDTFMAGFDPTKSEYVRTLGASMYDSITLLGRRACARFGATREVPDYYAALDEFDGPGPEASFVGLTGNIHLGDNLARMEATANISILSLAPPASAAANDTSWRLETVAFWAQDTLGAFPDQLIHNGGSPEPLPTLDDSCPPGTYSAQDPKHGCCAMCALSSTSCTAEESCTVVVPGSACRCDPSDEIRVVVVLEEHGPIMEGVVQAQGDFAARQNVFEGLECNKRIILDHVPINADVGAGAGAGGTTAPDVISALVGTWVGNSEVRVDAIVSPSRFELAEAIGILVAGSTPLLIQHPGGRFSRDDMAGSLVQLADSVEIYASRLGALLVDLNLHVTSVMHDQNGESLDFVTAFQQASAALNISTAAVDLTSSDLPSRMALVKKTRINVHVLALRCADPVFSAAVLEAHAAGVAVPGSAWFLPLWNARECNELEPSVRQVLNGAIAIGSRLDAVDLAYDSLAFFAKAVCALVPYNAIGEGFTEAVVAQMRSQSAMGRTGLIELTQRGTRAHDGSGASNISVQTLRLVGADSGGAGSLETAEVTRPSELVFLGGRSDVPSDTVLPEVKIARMGAVSGWTLAIAVISILSGLVCLAWTTKHRQHAVVKVAQFPFLVLVIIGTLVQSIAIVFLVIDDQLGESVATLACRGYLWLMAIGFDLTFGPMIMRLLRIAQVVRITLNKTKIALRTRDVVIGVGAFCLVDIGLLSTLSIGPGAISYKLFVTRTDEYGKPTEMVGMCHTSKPDLVIGIMAYHLLVLLLGGFVCWGNQGISSAFSEHKPLANAILTVLQIQSISIPVFFMVQDDPSPRVFVQAMMILLMVGPTLAWVFGSKVLYMRGLIKDDGFGHELVEEMTKRSTTVKSKQSVGKSNLADSGLPSSRASSSKGSTRTAAGGASSKLTAVHVDKPRPFLPPSSG